MAGPFCSFEKLMEGLWGQSRMGGSGTHYFMTPFGSAWHRESWWYPRQKLLLGRPSARDYCKSGHITIAKQVSRHLSGELATFPWDPPGCRVVRTSSIVLHQEDNGGTDTLLSPCSCHLCSLSPGAASSVTSLACSLSSAPFGFLLFCMPSLCASDLLITWHLAAQVDTSCSMGDLLQRIRSWTPY